MRNIKPLVALLLCVALCGCGKEKVNPEENSHLSLYDYEQTPAHLGIDPDEIPKPAQKYKPLNFETQTAMWFTAQDYASILLSKTEKEFREAVEERFENAAQIGINTLYVQVRAFGDAYYESELYSKGLYTAPDMDFDPLRIMTEIAHAKDLSIHAWINPLRCQTETQMKAMDDKYVIKQWYIDDEKNGSYLSLVDGRYWLCPGYEEVRSLIAEGAAELVREYEVDGIHIDDYFYPTSDEAFDRDAFETSDFSSLNTYRKEQCSLMVQEMYKAVKAENEDVLFGISPQGTLKGNDSQYADVVRWCSEDDFCDYIVPQIYFGLKNEAAPFEKTVLGWKELATSDVDLVIGICTYKMGQTDKYAGSGKNEWIEDKSIPSKETQIVFDQGLGCAVYSYASTFEPSETAASYIESERAHLAEIIKESAGTQPTD